MGKFAIVSIAACAAIAFGFIGAALMASIAGQLVLAALSALVLVNLLTEVASRSQQTPPINDNAVLEWKWQIQA